MGLGTFSIPGVIVALEKLIDKPGFVVLWFETDPKNIRESYSSLSQAVFSRSGYCSFAETVRPLEYPETLEKPHLRLEVWEWTNNEEWQIRSLSDKGLLAAGLVNFPPFFYSKHTFIQMNLKLLHSLALCVNDISNFSSVCSLCRIWKENLDLWNLDSWEVTSIMRSSFVLTERYANLTKSSMMQVTTQDVRMMREEGKTETFGLNHGLTGFERCPGSVYWQKHPTKPILFEYPSDDVYQKTGLFLVTAEADKSDEIPKQSTTNVQYNRALSGSVKNSSTKRQRLWRYEEEEEEDNSLE